MKLPFKPSFLASALIAGISLMASRVATAQTLTTLHGFTALKNNTNADGSYPDGALLLSGNILYGTAGGGGASSNGTVFAVNTDGTGFRVLHDFSARNNDTNADGSLPEAGLILSGDTLYGTASFGGAAGWGTVFSLNTNGSNFKTLWNFLNGGDGASPMAGLTLSGDILYGTAEYGGDGGAGTVFALYTGGSHFLVLHGFTNGEDGANPVAGLALSGNTLYGTTVYGGASNDGTVFSINTNGSDLTILHAFTAENARGTNGDGILPYAGLVISGNILYGAASQGGHTGHGTVFSLNTDGTGFKTLYSFTSAAIFFNSDGESPRGTLVLADYTLYGTAYSGGAYGLGTAFSVSTNGTDFKTLCNFGHGTNGFWPLAGLALSGHSLYGTTSWGGRENLGTVFSLSGPSIGLQEGSLKVTISPAAAVIAGAQWQLDNGAANNSEVTLTDLPVGSYTISYIPVPGWITPLDATVKVVNDTTTEIIGIYKVIPPGSALITLRTIGDGTIAHGVWPDALKIGTKYMVTAVPKPGNIFSNWVGGTSNPFSVLSDSPSYTFTMQSNLVLRADFVTNPFIPLAGAFSGLYLDTNDVAEESSGFFTLTLTASGAFTGKIMTSGSTYTLPTTNKFGPGGQTQFTTATKLGALTFNLQLDINDPAGHHQITGTVSNDLWAAELTADRAVFNAITNKATNYEGRYTLAIAGAAASAKRPGGDGWASLSVSSAGIITTSGSLADGTAISQSSVSVSEDGRWPFYAAYPLPPAGNGGAIFGWLAFSNQPAKILDGTLHWFRPAGKTPAVYQDGFTNAPAVNGSTYDPTNKPLLALSSGQVTLENGGLPGITNAITLTPSDAITLTNPAEDTNKLALTITKTTGVITGTFANPESPAHTIKASGVLLQNQTNAAGYFLGTNESGAFTVDPQ